MAALLLLDVLLCSVTLYLLGQLITKRFASAKHDVPLGPRPLPLLGNIFDMPTNKKWKTFADWGKRFGSISMVEVLGQKIFILNKAQDAINLLEKRSAIYSGRPFIPMADLIGWHNSFTLNSYGTETFRVGRTLFHRTIGTSSMIEQYYAVEEQETQKLLRRLLRTPGDFADHVRTTAGAIILRIAYGYRIQEDSDPFVTLADESTNAFSGCVAPGAFLVNMIPILKHIPAWFPGASFQRTAQKWREIVYRSVEEPVAFVKQQMAEGIAESSVTSKFLEDKLDDETEFHTKWAVASMYAGGADTTVAAVHSFFKAMMLYPEVQRKAQAEIDNVIGNSRLPTCEDQEQLPYIKALALEVLRWHTVTPSALPHIVTEDNTYNGFFFPKGSMIIANVWGMSHDAEEYPSPLTFDPERYLSSSPQRDPRTLAFGFGRRRCPGSVLADCSVFLACAMTLASFNILPCEGEEMTAESFDMDQTSGTLSHPTPFKCRIEPRSAAAVELINGEL